MAALIDPPSWPAHGTLFAHLVSDSSLEELHAVATVAGLHPRAFDRDHYDVPAAKVDAAVAAGAKQVSARELVRALGASGLRLNKRTAADRRAASRRVALQQFPLRTPEGLMVAADLLQRWSEPHRTYHDIEHLLHCLNSLSVLETESLLETEGHQAPRTVRLAAWFHDAIHTGAAAAPGEDERASAALAEELLPGLVEFDEVAEVASLVRVTIDHAPAADDINGGLLSDADLSILGSDPDDYRRYLRRVRREYGDVPADEFRKGRRAVVESLLTQDPLYATETGRRLWEGRARTNLAAELEPGGIWG